MVDTRNSIGLWPKVIAIRRSYSINPRSKFASGSGIDSATQFMNRKPA